MHYLFQHLWTHSYRIPDPHSVSHRQGSRKDSLTSRRDSLSPDPAATDEGIKSTFMIIIKDLIRLLRY